jgi:hypothetical protein
MTILGSDDADQVRTILEDLVEEALEGQARAKLVPCRVQSFTRRPSLSARIR